MRRMELLIEDSRRETENEELTEGVGLDDLEFIRYANDAQYRLQSKIAQKSQKIFVAEVEFSPVARQEAYDLPADALWKNRVASVEFSPTGNVREFYKLKPATLSERNDFIFGDPVQYIRLGGKVFLSPVPESTKGTIRITYIKAQPRLDVRRGTVLSVTLDNSANTITALSLDPALVIQDTRLLKESRMSVVDDEGDQQMRRIKFSAIDTVTGVVTIDPAFVFDEGETISVGDFVLSGNDSANRVDMDCTVERYIIAYMNWKAIKRDSSSDMRDATAELQALEQEIINGFADADDDIISIPVTTQEFIIDFEII